MSERPEGAVASPSNPEDIKIIGLARSARARTGADQGACLRDTDGRTYAATDVALAHLRLSAVSVTVAMAVSSGSQGLEAVALAGSQGPTDLDLDVLSDLPGSGVVVWWTDPAGVVQDVIDVRG
ncbi:MAG TPA: cytidine deaminase [Propionibacteriaceae bacterium]|nr:cytidine deaminase [Propionibacteriaceae bacterium]